MTKNNPIQDIKLRKEMLRLQIRQQEMEIERSARDLGSFFTFPAIKNSLFEYVARNPESAFRAGLIAVNVFSKIFQGSKKKAVRKKTTRKTVRK
jgi:hypothetical protein